MKYRILCMLKENAPEYVSGEVLSRKLNVSRTAVWKNINGLVSEGYCIDATSRKGYRLISFPDKLNEYEIACDLGTAVVGRKVLYLDVVDSTNNQARKLASEGCDDGTVVVAGKQTAGRGRLGRKWESHEGMGIYLSVVLKPIISPEEIQIIPIAASVAVTQAIEAVTGVRTGIKWPNDIILDNKKVCGISTEMNSEMEKVNFIILGIGINFSQKPEDFTPELHDKAISLGCLAGENHLSTDISKKLNLIRAVLSELDRIYSLIINGHSLEIIKRWKNYTLTLNKNVRIIYRDREYTGTAMDITNDGRLVVGCDDGIIREVMSGEVSVRGLLGYV
jgi:BirA family transcriptional regulator, biotin operon repressor / biotin---[acetyl-CoA-carboxylase] ligase